MSRLAFFITSGMASKQQIVNIYRDTLKELRKYIVRGDWTQYRDYLHQEFKNTPATKVSLQTAEEVKLYIQSVAEYTGLLRRYHIGTFVDDTERMKKIADRVGFKLPNAFNEDELSQEERENLKQQINQFIISKGKQNNKETK